MLRRPSLLPPSPPPVRTPFPLYTHAAFWTGVALFFGFYFGRGPVPYAQSLLFVALLLPVAMGTTYVLTAFLVPRFLLRRRYGRFALYSLYTLVASVYLELLIVVAAFVFLADYELSAVPPAALDVTGMVLALYVTVLLALAADLAGHSQRLRAAHAEAERLRLAAELERLKAQLHPHFLFNTLNNLYGLTLERSDAAPDAVLRIAELLDYMLYRCDGPLVPLDGEIAHLQAFIALETLRYSTPVDVRVTAPEPPTAARIAPLLLMPLVENAFTHGVHPSIARPWVHIALGADHGTLAVEVANSRPATAPADASDRTRSGIGLANVRQRLALLYPNSHTLDVAHTADAFRVRLTLPIHASDDPLPSR